MAKEFIFLHVIVNGIVFIFQGAIQRIFYRKDRKCHFLNWIVIVDVLGFVVLSRPGFLGRVHDNTCLSYVISCCRIHLSEFELTLQKMINF